MLAQLELEERRVGIGLVDDYIDIDRQRGLMCRDSNDTVPSMRCFRYPAS